MRGPMGPRNGQLAGPVALWGLVLLAACDAPTVQRAPPPRTMATAFERARCAAVAGTALPHATICETRFVDAESTVVASSNPARAGPRSWPAYCRVLGVSRPTADSEIHFEVAIPAGEAWNGRYLQVGNGAFAGSIPEDDILDGLASGYAVAGTDDGHQAGPADAAWALGHPEKMIDYGYRAVKETSDAARAVIWLFKGRRPSFSYFTGCSDGGREALMEAQRYPEDFDGIVAGAPPTRTAHVLAGFAWNVRALTHLPGSAIPRSKLGAIETAALRACGDMDGVVEDPLHCRFDPRVLTCARAEDDGCLTPAQVTALAKIYAGATNPRTGELIVPGLEPGAEAERQPDGWAMWISGPVPSGGSSGDSLLSTSFFRYMVFGDPSYDISRLDFDADVATADAKVASTISPDDPDLGRFERRGGKLIHYHGWSDATVPPRLSVAYYERVQRTMGDTSSFYRLFMAPGMAHCDGGRGPDVLATLDAITVWVERGAAPDRLIATKFVGGLRSNGVARTRPLCPYPQQATWDGRGSRASADSYRCGSETAR